MIFYECMPLAKLPLHWSVKDYQETYKWHSGCGLDTSINRTYVMKTTKNVCKNYISQTYACSL